MNITATRAERADSIEPQVMGDARDFFILCDKNKQQAEPSFAELVAELTR